MKRLIDTGLEQLTGVLLRMGELAHKTVSLSIVNYVEGTSGYTQVQDLSDTLVLLADEIEDKAFELMSRFQPVASDLRILKSYIKIAYDFTRYGRYALDVSQIYESLGGIRGCESWSMEAIKEMSEKTLSMVGTSVESLKRHDAKLARTLSKTEKQVDNLYFRYLNRLVEDAPTMNRCTISCVLVVRYLERIADHATLIGESIVYIATGKKEKLG
jgi:phosphate transport system protein